MMYEMQMRKRDGSSAKEIFTAANDKKAIQRIDSALERNATPLPNQSYRLIDAKGRIVREAELPPKA